MKRNKKKGLRKKRIVLKVFVTVCLVLSLGAGVYAYSIYHSASTALDNAFIPVETKRETEVKNTDPISVLLLGIDRDEGRGSGGRSDTMMVVTINPNDNSTKILSIARDSRVEIAGRGTLDKINHAYAFGGAQMSIDTVQNFLDIPIDFYAEIDMDGFMSLIDIVGGVSVENTSVAFAQDGFNFPLGTLNLTSEEALIYTRMRYEDPNGDFGRQARQRDVTTALAKEIAGYAVTRYQDIFDTMGSNMKTNLSMGEITAISMNYRNALKEIEQLDLRGSGEKINGVYYQIISDSELKEVQTILKEHLEIS